MITAGVIILLFVGYELYYTGVYTGHEQAALRDRLQQSWQAPTAPAANPASTEPLPVPVDLGSGVAMLRVPRLGADWAKVVVEGVDVEDLKKGPGIVAGTFLQVLHVDALHHDLGPVGTEPGHPQDCHPGAEVNRYGKGLGGRWVGRRGSRRLPGLLEPIPQRRLLVAGVDPGVVQLVAHEQQDDHAGGDHPVVRGLRAVLHRGLHRPRAGGAAGSAPAVLASADCPGGQPSVHRAPSRTC